MINGGDDTKVSNRYRAHQFTNAFILNEKPVEMFQPVAYIYMQFFACGTYRFALNSLNWFNEALIAFIHDGFVQERMRPIAGKCYKTEGILHARPNAHGRQIFTAFFIGSLNMAQLMYRGFIDASETRLYISSRMHFQTHTTSITSFIRKRRLNLSTKKCLNDESSKITQKPAYTIFFKDL